MKGNRLIKCFAAFVMVLYIVSVCGLNVHTCSHTGHTYVTFLFEGTDCQTIHGEHHHACECCGHHHEHSCSDENGCCHNESVQLFLAGDDDYSQTHHFNVPQVQMAIPAIPVVCDVARAAAPAFIGTCHSRPPVVPDILSSFCVLVI